MTLHSLIKISSTNVRGMHDFQKRRDLLHHLRQKKFQIYCLQDTHFTENLEPYICAEWGGQILFSSNTSNSRGVCILFNNDFEYKILKDKHDINGNFIALDLEIEGKRVTLINIYGPNEDSPTFYMKIVDIIEEFENDTCIICGDFNLVQNQELDTHNYIHINNPRAKEFVLNMKEDYNLVDPFRELNDEMKRYTWRKPTPLKQARLDFFLISESLMPSVQNFEIQPSYRTDHSTIVLSLQINEFIKGKGLWKFNNSLLKDMNYIEAVKKCINNVKEQYMLPIYDLEFVNATESNNIQFTISDQLFLEMLLMEIRGKTIAYSSYKKKQNLLREENLQEEIRELEREPTLNLDKIEEKKTELQNIRKEKIQGVMIRARVRWAEEGEKPTKYFCGLESRNYTSKTIFKVKKDDDTIVNKQEEVLKEVKNFYSKLYQKQESGPEIDTDIDNILKNLQEAPKLSNNEKFELEGEIKLHEISYVLKKMKNNKSPGSDGFTVEFFKFFYNDLKVFIQRAINEGYRTGKLSVTQRQGIITCLPKGDKSKEFLKNWRPITLLNVIYKIASGCIAERLKTVLSKLISTDQTGFISGRYIGENTRLIYDIMNFTDEINIPGLLLIIDFEKAFDTISWTFIQKVLSFFNFGESIKHWVYLFYNDITSAIIQSGFLSEFFHMFRGCRQGDPLSPYVFLLCAEILSLMLKKNKDMKGIKIGETEYRLSQFADDTTIILDGTERSFVEAINILRLFANISGLKINNSKTRAVWIGSRKFCGETFNHRYKLDWKQTDFTILGIKFSCNLDKMIKLNFEDKMKQIEHELKQWSKRILTPFGRITILKTLIISKFNHLFISLPNPPEELINTLNKMFFNFIWQSKVDRIKRDVLMQEYDKGGLKMIHLDKYILALKCTWIRRLIKTETNYKIIFEKTYTQVSNLITRGTEYLKQIMKNKNNQFWNDVLSSWIKFCDLDSPTSFEDILSVNIWNNKDIKIANKTIFYKQWFNKHIYFIKDLIDIDGSFMNFNTFCDTYQIQVNFLEFWGIRSAIESFIRRKRIEMLEAPNMYYVYLPYSIKEILKNKKGSKDIYAIFNKKEVDIKSQIKWNNTFEYTNLNWKLIYNIPAKCCSNTKLHWFQYRILHRILATNCLLVKMKIIEDNLCSFCRVLPETIEHLFWHCTLVTEFWESIDAWLYETIHFSLNINKQTALFGITYNVRANKPINYILILTRYYIYKCRINNKQLSLQAWRKEVKQFLNIEKYIAIKNSNYEQLARNWNKWLILFET